jgi:hypothetical protein
MTENTVRGRRGVSKSIYVTTCFVASLDELHVSCVRAAAIKSVNDAFTRYTQVSPSPFVPLGDTSYVTSIANQYIMSKIAGYKLIYTLPFIDLTTIIHH